MSNELLKTLHASRMERMASRTFETRIGISGVTVTLLELPSESVGGYTWYGVRSERGGIFQVLSEQTPGSILTTSSHSIRNPHSRTWSWDRFVLHSVGDGRHFWPLVLNLFHMYLGFRIVATDMENVTPLLQRNVELNAVADRCTVIPFKWFVYHGSFPCFMILSVVFVRHRPTFFREVAGENRPHFYSRLLMSFFVPMFCTSRKPSSRCWSRCEQ